MKILDEKRAPNPRRVRVFLAEKGIDVPFEQVEIMTGAHKLAGFTKLNPVQRVPVLVLNDGTAISESMAICRYFEAIQPEPSLFGETPIEIALIEMWNRRAELNFFLPVAQHFPAHPPRDGGSRSPAGPGLGRGEQAARRGDRSSFR